MNPGPQLHRSLTFWAGLIIILFTCLAWRDSHTNVSSISWKKFATVSSASSGIVMVWSTNCNAALEFSREAVEDPSHYDPFEPPFFLSWKPPAETSLTHPCQLQESYQYWIDLFGPGTWVLFVPYCLILLPLILIWTALLIVRARRRRRAFTAPAQRHSD